MKFLLEGDALDNLISTYYIPTGKFDIIKDYFMWCDGKPGNIFNYFDSNEVDDLFEFTPKEILNNIQRESFPILERVCNENAASTYSTLCYYLYLTMFSQEFFKHNKDRIKPSVLSQPRFLKAETYKYNIPELFNYLFGIKESAGSYKGPWASLSEMQDELGYNHFNADYQTDELYDKYDDRKVNEVLQYIKENEEKFKDETDEIDLGFKLLKLVYNIDIEKIEDEENRNLNDKEKLLCNSCVEAASRYMEDKEEQ